NDQKNFFIAVILGRTGLANQIGYLVARERLTAGSNFRDHTLSDWLSLNRLREEATIHTDVRARHETAGVRGQKDGGANQFLSASKPAHRSMAPDGQRPFGGRTVFVE